MIRRAQILFDLSQIFMSFRMKVVTIYSSIIPRIRQEKLFIANILPFIFYFPTLKHN